MGGLDWIQIPNSNPEVTLPLPSLETDEPPPPQTHEVSSCSVGPDPAALSLMLPSGGVTPTEEEGLCGDGRCTAHALWRIGIDDFPSVINGLDNVMQQFPTIGRTRAVFGQLWPLMVIQKYVVTSGWHFHKVPIEVTLSHHVHLEATLSSGSFFVYGHVNQSFYMGNRQMITSDDTSTDPKEWEHSVACVNGRFFEFNHDTKKMTSFSTQWLHLLPSNKPDPAKGYFHDITAVYRVFLCTADSTEKCKGACWKPDVPKKRVRAAHTGQSRRSARLSV